MSAIDQDTSIDPTAIRHDAEGMAGLDEWDDDELQEPLTVLTDALAAEAELHDTGRATAGARLRDLVAGYIRMQGDAAEHPEILDEKVERPIVIVGLPRSGTTLLHGLLAADPRHRAPVWWEALLPSPPPDAARYDTDPRRAKVQAQFDAMIERNPSLLASLPYSADLAAECNTIVQPTLRSVAFPCYYHVPSYEAWYLRADQRSAYRYHHRALKQLQWRGPRGRWVLKAPPHLLTMDDLVAEYPDARLIQTHRDPKAVLASNCALYLANRVLHTDHVDPTSVGAESLDLWATACDRADSFRARHPGLRIADVHYDDLVADPLATAEQIYRSIEAELTSEASSAMEAWLAENARDKRPIEHHQLDEFGLSAERVDERFAAYRRHHGLG